MTIEPHIEWASAASAVAALRVRWVEMQFSATPHAQMYSAGMVRAYLDIGLLNELEGEAWTARFLRCPDPTHDRDPRVWCAYCGDIPRGDIELDD